MGKPTFIGLIKEKIFSKMGLSIKILAPVPNQKDTADYRTVSLFYWGVWFIKIHCFKLSSVVVRSVSADLGVFQNPHLNHIFHVLELDSHTPKVDNAFRRYRH